MTEEEFVSSRELKPFGTADVSRLEAQGRRAMELGNALWGRTVDDLQRQLLAPHPEIPAGYDLSDFRKLREFALKVSALLSNPRFAWSLRSLGVLGVNTWEDRCEIVRRAIEYLESR